MTPRADFVVSSITLLVFAILGAALLVEYSRESAMFERRAAEQRRIEERAMRDCPNTKCRQDIELPSDHVVRVNNK